MRSSGQPSLVTDRRCQRKGAEEDERVSLRSVRSASTSTFPHLNTGTEAPMLTTPCKERAALGAATECHGSNVNIKNKLIGPSTSLVFGSRRNATLRRGWMSGVTCTRERRMVTSTQTEELAIHPFELHAETSQVRRATTGRRVNLHEHACDTKWVVRHAAVMVVLDRECARRRRGPAFARKEPAGKQRAPTQGLV